MMRIFSNRITKAVTLGHLLTDENTHCYTPKSKIRYMPNSSVIKCITILVILAFYLSFHLFKIILNKMYIKELGIHSKIEAEGEKRRKKKKKALLGKEITPPPPTYSLLAIFLLTQSFLKQ